MPDALTLPWCLDDEHAAWQKTMQDFAARAVAPGARDRDLAGELDPTLLEELGRLGAFGLLVPELYAGSGADLRSLCIALEELAVFDSSLAATVHVQNVCAALFHDLAGDRLRAEYLPSLVSGESFGAFGLTESTGGSDPSKLATRARRDGDHWIINGQKEFISNCGTPRSQWLILFAMIDEQHERRSSGVSAFLIPLDAPGVAVGPNYRKLGWRGADTHPIFLDDVRIPLDGLLGLEGQGLRSALTALGWSRICFGALSSGLARGCVDATLNFVESRESFSHPLGSHQAVALGIADMSAMADTIRLLTYDAAWKYDRGEPHQREATVGKLMATEMANTVAYRATQLSGGYGFMDDSDVARHYRDARVLTIAEGTSEILRLMIARRLGLPV